MRPPRVFLFDRPHHLLAIGDIAHLGLLIDHFVEIGVAVAGDSVPTSFQDQLVARSETIDRKLFCSTSCLKITRLLNTPDIGRLTA